MTTPFKNWVYIAEDGTMISGKKGTAAVLAYVSDEELEILKEDVPAEDRFNTALTKLSLSGKITL